MLGGINKAIVLSCELLSVYALWLGVFKVAERAGLTQKLAAKLTPAVNKLFGKTSKKTAELISLNLAANALGMSGLATPYGVEACRLLERENNNFGARLLLIIAATSIQLLPTSVMALMAAKGAENPASIILPSALCTAASTVLGVTLALIFKPRKIKPHGFKTLGAKPRIFKTREKKRQFFKASGKKRRFFKAQSAKPLGFFARIFKEKTR